MEKAKQDTPIAPLRILKTAACPTLSGKGKGTLTYHIGCTPDSEVHFRMASNSGGGYFSPEWVALKDIQESLDKGHKPLTSFSLWPLFKGKSVNTPSFLFAALLEEGLVQRDAENPRVYVCCPPDKFMAEVAKLISSDVDIKVAEKISGKGVVKNRPKTVDVIPVMTKSKGRPKKPQPEAIKS